MNKVTYEHWEGQNEYIILFGGPIGQTVTKEEAIIITKWLNNGGISELKERLKYETQENKK